MTSSKSWQTQEASITLQKRIINSYHISQKSQDGTSQEETNGRMKINKLNRSRQPNKISRCLNFKSMEHHISLEDRLRAEVQTGEDTSAVK